MTFWVFCCGTTCWWVLSFNNIVTHMIDLRLDHHVYVSRRKRCHRLRYSSFLTTDRLTQRWKRQEVKTYTAIHFKQEMTTLKKIFTISNVREKYCHVPVSVKFWLNYTIKVLSPFYFIQAVQLTVTTHFQQTKSYRYTQYSRLNRKKNVIIKPR